MVSNEAGRKSYSCEEQDAEFFSFHFQHLFFFSCDSNKSRTLNGKVFSYGNGSSSLLYVRNQATVASFYFFFSFFFFCFFHKPIKEEKHFFGPYILF